MAVIVGLVVAVVVERAIAMRGVRMTSMGMLMEEYEADNVDDEADHGDHQQRLGLDVLGLIDSLNALAEDIESDEYQEQSIEESS